MKQLKLMSIALACAMLITGTPSVFGLSLPFSPLSRMSTEKGIHTPTVRINEETLGYDIFDALEILKHLVGMVTLTTFEKEVYTFTDNNGSPSIFDALEVLKGLVKMRPLPRINPLFPPTSSNNLPTEKAGGAWTSASEGRYKPPAGWKNAEYPWTPPSDWIEYDEDGSWGPGGGTTDTTDTDETSDDNSDTAPTDTTDVTETDETNTSLSDITTSSGDIVIPPPSSDTTNSSPTEATTTTENTTSTTATTTTEATTSTAATTTTANTTSTAATTSSAATTTAATTTSATTTTATTTSATTITEVSTSLDPSAPTGQISIKSNIFTSFFNGVTFGMFFKNTVDVTITSPDTDIIEYFLSETTLTSGTNWDTITWETYSAPFSVDADFKGVVYAKFTKTENELTTIINSNGLVVFIDSEIGDNVVNYVKNSGIDQTVEITLNCNTVSRIVYNGNPLNNGDYEVNDNRITFKSSFLETLSVGDNQKLTVFYNPLGVEFVDGDDNENVSATEIIVNILPAQETSTNTSETGTSEFSETSSGGTTSSYTTSSGGTTSSYTTSSGGTLSSQTTSSPGGTSSSATSSQTTIQTTTSAGTTSSSASPSTSAGGDSSIIYDMLTDPDFELLTSTENHPLFNRRNGSGMTVTLSQSPRSVAVATRSGSTQGLVLDVDKLGAKAGHSYTISYSGVFTNTSGTAVTATARLRRETGPQLVLATQASNSSGVFTLTHTTTAEIINLGAGSFIALGCSSSSNFPNLTYTAITITEICPNDCLFHGPNATTATTTTFAEEPGVLIYNMQNDPELFLLDRTSSRPCSHTWLKANRNTYVVDMGWANTDKSHSLSYTGSSSRGFGISLDAFAQRANHSYEFAVFGKVDGTSNSSFTLHTAKVEESSSADTTVRYAQVATTPAPPTGFTLRYRATQTEIAAHKTAGATHYQVIGGSGRNVVITNVTIKAICPAGCTQCTAMPPIPAIDTSKLTGSISSSLTAAQLIGRIGMGWNLGNTFDGHSTSTFAEKGAGYEILDGTSVIRSETTWLSDSKNATSRTLIQKVKSEGFNAIRIPVTWYKFADKDNNWKIDPAFLARVKQVVDWAMAEDMIVVLNSHHDGYPGMVIPLTGDADSSSHAGRIFIERIWTQLANEFKDYNERLIFEGLNEPRNGENWSGSSTDRSNLNKLNQRFVTTVRNTGGNNSNRILMCPSIGANVSSIDGFTVPNDTASVNKIAMSVHIYAPHSWAHDGNGSYGGSSTITTQLETIRARARTLGVPVVLGEFGSISDCSSSSRITHAGDYIRAAKTITNASNGVTMKAFWWDDNSKFGLIPRRYPHNISTTNASIIAAMNNNK